VSAQSPLPPSGAAGAIRPAATLIVLRRRRAGPEVLMGQRGTGAAFLASQFVFPGGAVDPQDAHTPLARPLGQRCAQRLADSPEGPSPGAFAAAALRETREETGLILGRAADAGGGVVADAGSLRYVFRAITPPGRPRRFDARFFLAEADAIHGDPEDFGRADGELSHLRWLSLDETRRLDLPFVTEVMLAEVARLAAAPPDRPPERVAFFDNTTAPRFRWID
jgi:8-oxo-dGTP pyrophosphatase MutT (NUDIX family)